MNHKDQQIQLMLETWFIHTIYHPIQTTLFTKLTMVHPAHLPHLQALQALIQAQAQVHHLILQAQAHHQAIVLQAAHLQVPKKLSQRTRKKNQINLKNLINQKERNPVQREMHQTNNNSNNINNKNQRMSRKQRIAKTKRRNKLLKVVKLTVAQALTHHHLPQTLPHHLHALPLNHNQMLDQTQVHHHLVIPAQDQIQALAQAQAQAPVQAPAQAHHQTQAQAHHLTH